MKFRMSAPSKTFLAGEYAVMAGGPALLLNTEPRFQFRADRTAGAGSSIDGIPDGSPAHTWLKQRSPLLEGWRISFEDPHGGRGGFGASGAQFLFVHVFTTLLQFTNRKPKLNLHDLFNDYQVCARGSGSGADILSQYAGGAARVNAHSVTTERLEWPYPDLGFAIVRTGSKTATHTHLAALDKARLNELVAPAKALAEGFGSGDGRTFAARVNEYGDLLAEMNLQAPRTLELVSSLRAQKWCRAAKGCGAYGADTIVLLFEKADFAEAADYAQTQGLPLVASQLSGGLEVIHETD